MVTAPQKFGGAMTKKPATVRVGNIEVPPVTAAERKRIDKRINRKHDQLRKQYKEVRGKKVDWIDYNYEEGSLYVNVRFMDGTNFSLDFRPEILTTGEEFSDMSSADDEIIKTYYLRRD
jgi:hypothetical protein